jgi:uncharacterized membrane protein YdbT with pleckstrin-like domain
VETVQRLSETKLFGVLSEADQIHWASKFRFESHGPGKVVFHENERATAFYIVDRGKLRAQARVDDKDIPLAYFYAGDYFGETGLITGEPRNATVDVLTHAELLVLDKKDFDQLMDDFPDIHRKLYAISRQRETAGRIRFPWQQPDEVTLFFSTKHWIALLRALRLTVLMAVLGLFSSAVYLSSIGAQLPLIVSLMLMITAGTLLGFALFFAVYHYLDWRNDHYIITNLRILHVERVLLLREDRDEAPFERVEDVNVKKEGLLANLLEFGSVFIQTAAATEQIVFADVANPDYVHDALFTPMQHTQAQDKSALRESIQQVLSDRLNITVMSSEEHIEGEKAEESAFLVDEAVEERGEPPGGPSGFLARSRQRLRDLFTFETRIVSDGGNTVTWRKNGWLLISASMPPLFAALFFTGLALLNFARNIAPPAITAFLLALLLPVFGWWFYVYWDWQNDIYQISGNRLLDLKKRPLFLEEMRRETTLDRVQNISLSIPSPVAQLLNYGTVVIETAGESGAFRFESVHDPRRVQEEIFRRLDEYKRTQRTRQQHDRQAELAEWFDVYHKLRK